MYDVKITKSRQFLDPRIFHVNNFQVGISIAVEVQVQSKNFKPKRVDKVICGYLFKPVNIYYIEDVQVV